MDRIVIAVKAPLEASSDLRELIRDLGDVNAVPSESRALDGETLLTAIVSIGASTLPLLEAWLAGRTQRRQGATVQVQGMTFQGYTADEVVEIIQILKKNLGEADDN